MDDTHDYRKEAEKLRIIVEKSMRVLPKYRDQNKRLREFIEQNNRFHQQEIEDLHSQSQKQESEYKHEIELLKGQLSSFRYQAEELQKCRKDLEVQKSRLIKSRILCVILCVVLAVCGYSHFSSPAIPESHTVSAASPQSTPTPVKANIIDGASAIASKISSYSATYVWIPQSGKRYHDTKTCSNMINPSLVTLQEAKRLGYSPCGRCHPPR